MTEEIFSLALELSGMGEGEANGLSLCCKLAQEELTGKLKQGVTPESCGDTFSLVAAQLALMDWWAFHGRPKKFTAGDITVEEGQVDLSALRKQAMGRLAGKLADPGVAILGVRG